ncbi:MAG: type VI secretion system tube protein Hcp [Planctomycetes bacterium]|nr:type VI secretion system tube protein Hcp [Planctomycetota bacterium]
MAVDMFLKIDGVEGESKDKTHGKEIDVLAWSWGMSQTGTMHTGGGGGAGKVMVDNISLTKWLDSSSPDLMATCCSGKHYASAKLTVRKAGGDNPVEYLIIDLTNVLISSISTSASQHDDRQTEGVVLNFEKFKVTYTGQDHTGAAVDPKSVTWDIAANVK